MNIMNMYNCIFLEEEKTLSLPPPHKYTTSTGSRGGRSGAHAPGANHRGAQISNFKLVIFITLLFFFKQI